MSGRIVLFGATGYTGRLAAHELAARGARPVLAARSQRPLAELAAALGGLETAVADVSRPQTVRALVEHGDVLVSTVGPFARFGAPAVRAAVDAGAHYLDSTGEAPFIREVFDRFGPAARRAGAGLVTAFGYDFVPGNLAAELALRDAGARVARVDVGYFVTGSGGFSGGTRASAAQALTEPAHTYRGAGPALVRSAERVRDFVTPDGRRRSALSLGASEHYALPRRHPGLREVNVYLGWVGPLSRPIALGSLAAAALWRLPGARGAAQRALGRLVTGSSGGPDAAERARAGSLVVAEAFDAAGARLAAVTLAGVNGYDYTARMLAWGATRAAAGGLRGVGALGPAEAFGLDELEAGSAEAGIGRG